MTWITLDTHRRSEDASWLRETFPVDTSMYPHQMLGADTPTRALDWTLQTPKPLGWVELNTGSLLLVEAVGGEERGGGTIVARLWIAPVNRIVEVADSQRYTDGEFPGGGDHASVLTSVLNDVAERLQGESLPGVELQRESSDPEADGDAE